MKHLFTAFSLTTLIIGFLACQHGYQMVGNYYEYELTDATEVYADELGGNKRLADMPAGTHVVRRGRVKGNTYQSVDYDGYNVFLRQPHWRMVRRYRGSYATEYKPIDTYAVYNSSVSTYQSSEQGNTPSNGAYIHTGPRGGHYYINSNGNKTYVKPGSSLGGSSSKSRSLYRSSGSGRSGGGRHK
ncbi:hypothetical protein J2I47_03140 [Fibrella sp. HMF5335]|uniref:PBCV-specific basic adaptor domain-containing protein n=1 Tax=Fibrella rubiginis TaxID=2817060 RepID=A0A939GEW9_9BACT|nr:hypothetical protein [Fibrella rubiginis]MBO0935535.1 hypothetical protein [Fibrella rubiginis]